MNSKHSRPRWWLMYLSVGSMIGVFFLESRADISPSEHRTVEILLFLIMFGAVWFWLKANDGNLMMGERDERIQESRQLQTPARPSPVRDSPPGVKRDALPQTHKPTLPHQVESWIEHFFG